MYNYISDRKLVQLAAGTILGETARGIITLVLVGEREPVKGCDSSRGRKVTSYHATGTPYTVRSTPQVLYIQYITEELSFASVTKD